MCETEWLSGLSAGVTVPFLVPLMYNRNQADGIKLMG